ncbi:XrtB/PEP-CTERM-associated polysaccharide biosynthesis outer membrane protein EpsL [Hydrogenophaga crocea]|uniref:Outer membrane beta-barrel protein n=1 Tax=Hydrogenophaga crocea TaxID=2716225 RepID=A0A6G8IC70_9BURK|nr:XrtB/PEP-CTERM-associated polysaccharide biosynthesis outer membrane protein EpsL [Hydrogenophaga crocea]QIM50733.1 outer membrane beta-barrel protein [Hydrogenophaga crocea]
MQAGRRAVRRLRTLPAPALALPLGLALGLAGPPLCAQPQDGLSLSAGYRIQHDDNLFRLPDGADPQRVLGRADAGETVRLRSVGLRYAHDFGLQRLEADLGLVDYAYDRYPQLDLLARNHDLRWRWAVTPWITGTLRSQRDESVNSFADASVLTQGNRRLRRDDSADLRWQVDARWSLLADVRDTSNVNQQPLLGEASERLRSGAIGLRHDTARGSSAVLRLRSGRGETLDPLRTPDPLRDNGFSQDEWLLDLAWPATGQLSVDAGLARVQRRHQRLALRDYDATNTRLNLNWTPTAKTLLRWSASEDTDSYQTAQSSIARTQRWSLLANWSITPRLALTLQTGEERRRALQPPPGQAPDPRRDRTRDQSLGLRWSVQDNASLDLRWQRVRRFSTDPGATFDSRALSLGLNASF